MTGYREGQRVIAGAICPNFNSYAAQDGAASQDGSYLVPQGLCGCHGYKATAGWRFGNLIDGTQAEYVLVPDATAAPAPKAPGHAPNPDPQCKQGTTSPDVVPCFFRNSWWSGGGSNSRPSHCERDALPAELPPQQTVIIHTHFRAWQ